MQFMTVNEIDAERASIIDPDEILKYDAEQERIFNEWCQVLDVFDGTGNEIPIALSLDERWAMMNRVTAYLRYRAVEDRSIPPVRSEKQVNLPQDRAGLRRFCWMSVMQWWYTSRSVMHDAKRWSEQTSDSALYPTIFIADNYPAQMQFATVHGDNDRELSVELCKVYLANQAYHLDAVIEHWCEPDDDSGALKNALESNRIWLDLIDRSDDNTDFEPLLRAFFLPSNPSVVEYARRRLYLPASGIPPYFNPRRGVLVRGFLVTNSAPFTYRYFLDYPCEWELIHQLDFSSRWVTGPILDAASRVALAQRNWVSEWHAAGVIERHRDLTGMYVHNRSDLDTELNTLADKVIANPDFRESYMQQGFALLRSHPATVGISDPTIKKRLRQRIYDRQKSPR